MSDSLPSGAASLEVGRPQRFNASAIVTVHAYGALLAIPLLVAVLVISSVKMSLGFLLAVPFAVIAATLFLLPFGRGNSYIVRQVRRTQPAAGRASNDFIVQLTCVPRLRSGLRAVLEDADDVGTLSLGGDALVFRGDSVRLAIPFSQISRVHRQNSGLRGLFIYGARLALDVEGLPNVVSLQFAERSSWLLPLSRQTTRKLYNQLAAKVSPSRG